MFSLELAQPMPMTAHMPAAGEDLLFYQHQLEEVGVQECHLLFRIQEVYKELQ